MGGAFNSKQIKFENFIRRVWNEIRSADARWIVLKGYGVHLKDVPWSLIIGIKGTL